MDYIDIKNYPKHLGIKKGDLVFISSDTRVMMLDAMRHNKNIDLNDLLDGLIDCVGENGTIIIPTYNWGFCKGATFDYIKTKGLTGSLGNIALERKDFKRTLHPIYSFAVYGKDKDYLTTIDYKSSFWKESVFGFMHKNKFTNYIFDCDINNSFTFAHYVEENSGYVKYRYLKDFTADYIDEKNNISKKTYSMFVRNLDINVYNDSRPLEQEMIKKRVETIIKINNSIIKKIDLYKAYDVILDDIINNQSKKFCIYDGQS